MVCIYILKLEQNKWYVGKLNSVDICINNHFLQNVNASQWTKLYRPIDVEKVFENCDDYDEIKYTLKYMDLYGIENVRGGPFSMPILYSNIVDHIEKMIVSTKNVCFNCKQTEHFSKDCKQPRKISTSPMGRSLPSGGTKNDTIVNNSGCINIENDEKLITNIINDEKLVIENNDDKLVININDEKSVIENDEKLIIKNNDEKPVIENMNTATIALESFHNYFLRFGAPCQGYRITADANSVSQHETFELIKLDGLNKVRLKNLTHNTFLASDPYGYIFQNANSDDTTLWKFETDFGRQYGIININTGMYLCAETGYFGFTIRVCANRKKLGRYETWMVYVYNGVI